MLTLRSASARQTFPSVPGRSSINTVNSLVTGMAGTSFCLAENAGCTFGLTGCCKDHTPLLFGVQFQDRGFSNRSSAAQDPFRAASGRPHSERKGVPGTGNLLYGTGRELSD